MGDQAEPQRAAAGRSLPHEPFGHWSGQGQLMEQTGTGWRAGKWLLCAVPALLLGGAVNPTGEAAEPSCLPDASQRWRVYL